MELHHTYLRPASTCGEIPSTRITANSVCRTFKMCIVTCSDRSTKDDLSVVLKIQLDAVCFCAFLIYSVSHRMWALTKGQIVCWLLSYGKFVYKSYTRCVWHIISIRTGHLRFEHFSFTAKLQWSGGKRTVQSSGRCLKSSLTSKVFISSSILLPFLLFVADKGHEAFERTLI